MKLKKYWTTGSQVSVMNKIKTVFTLLAVVHIVWWTIIDNAKALVFCLKVSVIYSMLLLLILLLVTRFL